MLLTVPKPGLDPRKSDSDLRVTPGSKEESSMEPFP